MSGFLAILNLDGAPIEPAVLSRMTATMAQRGPDAERTWAVGPFGLGHTELRVEHESRHGRQPCTLDGRTWITADARLDARQELTGRLVAAGRHVAAEVSDAELILHAYHTWQDDCAGRLLGDFAFVIWDGDRRRLFCACDHFGVKPLYYACTPATFIASNALPAILAHPDVSTDLNELAVADFLLFGGQQDAENTIYAGIKCLPAAHTLACSATGRITTRRYWSLPTDGHIRYRRNGEYVEHFADLLATAVKDRLPPDRAAILMSGGLDSTTIAAVAKECSCRRTRPCELRAHTMTYHELTGSPEGEFARLAGRWIDIPVEVFDGSSFHPFANWQLADWVQPEPCDLTFAEANRQFMLGIQRTGARVVLTGQGGDPLFATTRDLFWNLLRGLRLPQIASYLTRHFWNYRRLPPMLIRSRLKRRFVAQPLNPFPEGIEPSFTERWDLQERWRRAQNQPTQIHATRPEAYAGLAPAFWQRYFRRADAAMTNLGMESRHPLLDVRLVEYLLAIPPSPSFLEKSIVREATRGKLPERIRRRPKCPAGDHPAQAYLARNPGTLLPECAITDGLDRFVQPSAARNMAAGSISCKDGGVGIGLRCLSLGVWLHHSHCVMAEESTT